MIVFWPEGGARPAAIHGAATIPSRWHLTAPAPKQPSSSRQLYGLPDEPGRRSRVRREGFPLVLATPAGTTIDCGHHMSEEAPDELARILRDFFAP